MHSNSLPLGRARGLVAAVTAGLIASGALANATINYWNGPLDFHHKRVGVPDQDQKRVGLPNVGGCYCAPTSFMNVLMYVANYGYPAVVPGPGNYSGYDTYYEVTDLLDDLGGWAGISPGGDDPNDPDCIGRRGGDGTCAQLGCGGSFQNVYNSVVSHGWLGSAEDDLVWTARFIDDSAPVTNHANLAKLGVDGNVLAFCYGRYQQVGATPQGQPVFKRTTGHCVTMNESSAIAGSMLLFSRDPADDADIFGPSAYASKQYDVSTVTLNVTTDEDILLSWTSKTLSGLDEPHDDGKKRLVDGYIAVKPKSGTFWNDSFIQELPLSVDFGGTIDPGPYQTTRWAIVDLVLDQDQLGWFAIHGGNEVTQSQLVHIDPIEKTTTVIENTDAKRLVLGRMSELFTIATSAPTLRKYDLFGTLLKTVTLTGLPKAIAYDDANDRVLVLIPNTSGQGGTLKDFPRSLGSATEPVNSYEVPAFVQLGGDVRMSVNPKDGLIWVASSLATQARGLKKPSSPGGLMIALETMGTGLTALRDVSFEDSGKAYIVDGGVVKVFVKGSTGAWDPGDSSAFAGLDVGDALRLGRSRTNFDPAVHDTDAWKDVPFDELEVMGVNIPDCVGDLDGNSVVDAADLAILLGAWGLPGGIADLDHSGAVDAADLALMLGAWGPCPPV